MYIMGGRQHMTDGDLQFMKDVGIEPSGLDDPFPTSLPPPPPAEAPIPKLTEEDSRWLQDLRVAWEHEPEPEFVPPKTLREYLTRFPNGIREAVGEVAWEMGLAMSGGGLDDLTQEITQMFLDFAALGFEDVVALYEFHRTLRPEGFSFPDYMKFRVKACVETVLQNRMTSSESSGDSLGS
jgi:hypothetical protein